MSRLPIGVLRFPGTNCDRDVFEAVEPRGEARNINRGEARNINRGEARNINRGEARNINGGDRAEAADANARWLWHADQFDPKAYRALILPGGFSYGDYLRAGALAARSPAMRSVREAAARGVPVLGICNGFQILCEAQLLPGVLIRNQTLRFIDDWVELRLESQQPHFGQNLAKGHRARLPIAHADGRYFVESDELKRLQDKGQVWWTYAKNPNGATADIAGVMNEAKNVAALMPHPERAMFDWMGGSDGAAFFDL